MGRRRRSLPARTRPATLPFARDPERMLCACSPARSDRGTASCSSSAALARLHASGDDRFGAVFIGDGPERAAAERAARGVPGVVFTGALPHASCRRCLAAADIGVAPFDPDAPRAAAARVLLVAAQDLRVHGVRPAGRRAGAAAPQPARRRTDARDCSTIRRIRAGSTARSSRWPIRPCARGMGAAARARVVRDFSWDGALPRARRAPARAGDARERSAARPDRHRLVSARLRRQRLEHVGAGARPGRARASRRGREDRDRRGPSGIRETHVRGRPRHRRSAGRAATCRSSATCIKNERLWSALDDYLRRAAGAATRSTSCTRST